MLWALQLVRLGATRGFGAGLRRALTVGTRNRVTAFACGAAVTALLQSSTATILIISSFAGQSMIGASAAQAVILGANVGTTLVAQLMAFDVSWLAPVCLLAGVVLFSFDQWSKAKNIGRILIGLGLILMSLNWISESSVPIKDSPTLPLILQPLGGDNTLAIIVSSLLTWLAHSSLATVLLLMSLAGSGVLPVKLAMVMVLGANLGGAIPPVIATWRDSPAAIRVTIANLLVRFIGVLAAVGFVNEVEPYILSVSESPARAVVNFHLVFNVALVACFLPLTGIVAKLCAAVIPDRPDADDPSKPRYLNQKEVTTPAVALASAGRETLRMADVLQDMMEDTIKAFNTNDENLVQRIREKDDIIDSLYEALKRYMARLTQEYMSNEEAQRYVQTLTFATNLEHAGDIIDKNLMPLALKKIRNQRSFSQQGFQEIESIHNDVLESVRMAQNVFISNDLDLARKMLQEKQKIRRAEMEASINHIERLGEGIPETIATTSLHLDIIRDYRRINSYMCTVVYPLLEGKDKPA